MCNDAASIIPPGPGWPDSTNFKVWLQYMSAGEAYYGALIRGRAGGSERRCRSWGKKEVWWEGKLKTLSLKIEGNKRCIDFPFQEKTYPQISCYDVRYDQSVLLIVLQRLFLEITWLPNVCSFLCLLLPLLWFYLIAPVCYWVGVTYFWF